MERLQKYLARAGVASRRKAEKLIEQGKITVNNQKAVLGMKVSNKDIIRVENKPIFLRLEHITYALYKPRGVITTVKDTHQRQTVIDLVPKVKGLHPIGRLDANSEGLLLLTTDGDLTLKLTHPRYGHQKEYQVWCAEGQVGYKDLQALCKGVLLTDGWAKAVKSKPFTQGCFITLVEGRKHQVRRMLTRLNYKVIRLKRTRINKFNITSLKTGQYYKLCQKDFEKLTRKC